MQVVDPFAAVTDGCRDSQAVLATVRDDRRRDVHSAAPSRTRPASRFLKDIQRRTAVNVPTGPSVPQVVPAKVLDARAAQGLVPKRQCLPVRRACVPCRPAESPDRVGAARQPTHAMRSLTERIDAQRNRAVEVATLHRLQQCRIALGQAYALMLPTMRRRTLRKGLHRCEGRRAAQTSAARRSRAWRRSAAVHSAGH